MRNSRITRWSPRSWVNNSQARRFSEIAVQDRDLYAAIKYKEAYLVFHLNPYIVKRSVPKLSQGNRRPFILARPCWLRPTRAFRSPVWGYESDEDERGENDRKAPYGSRP